MRSPLPLFFLACGLLAQGCASYSYTLQGTDLGAPVELEAPLFVEPILENAELELRSASSSSGNVTTTTYWKDKPFFAQPHVRREVYKQLLDKGLTRKIVGTDALVSGAPEGGVRIVRTTVAEHRATDNNFFWQYMACAFGAGFLCPPLWIYNAVEPLRQTEQIRVVVQLFEIPSSEVAARLITRPDSAHPYIDTRGLEPMLLREFETTAVGEQGLVTSMADGLFMDQESREQRLVSPLVEYLEEAITLTASGGVSVASGRSGGGPSAEATGAASTHAY